MTQEHPMMVGAATVFVVSNITKSIEHYRNAESMRHENLSIVSSLSPEVGLNGGVNLLKRTRSLFADGRHHALAIVAGD
jgi:hypothetical protein